MVKILAFASAATLPMLAIHADEIKFTGADASNPTNLSSVANWSATPSADTVGVIDLSKTPALGYVVNGDGISLKGIRITGSGSNVTLGGGSTLTLGSGGISVAIPMMLRCPVAVAADQTWNFGEATYLRTYSTVSGAANLCISNFAQYVEHYASLNYGGKITYHRSSVPKDNKWIEYRGAGKWADAIHVASDMPLNLRPDSGKTVKWTDVFPVSNPTVVSASSNIGLNVGNMASAGTIEFGDGADLSFPADNTTPRYLTLAGHFRQTGGSIVKRQQYFLTLGHHAQDTSWTYAKPALYEMAGGSLNISGLLVGYNSTDTSIKGNRFVQTSGKVTLPFTGYGAFLQIGAGSGTDSSIAEYQMEGGTLLLGGYGNSYNLAIASPRINNTVMPASGFIMTGGTAESRCLTFGSDLKFWNESLAKMKNAFALLDLSGGALSFYSTYDGGNKEPESSFVHFCKAWNYDPADTNCFYCVKLHGGALNVSGAEQTVWPLQTCFSKSEVGTVLGGKDRNLSIPAPVHGTGVIRKEGAGGLFLSDASRFTGTLDVRGGVVCVEGNTTEDVGADDVDCFRWTADSLSSTYANGDRVSDWTDLNNSLLASTNGNPAVVKGGFVAPVFKANAYNGHSALTFNRSSLSVPIGSNPIYGKKSCTVVAVFKTESNGGSSTVAYGNSLLAVYPGATHSVFAMGLVSDPANANDGCRFALDRRFCGVKDTGRATCASRSGVTLYDGDIHAVAMTLDRDKVTFTVDADHTVTNYMGTAAIAPIGYQNESYTDKKHGDLFIGGHIVPNNNIATGVDGSAPFKGDLMEIRVYTNRLFTATEQRQVTKRLLQVYDGTPARMAKLESGANATGMGAPGKFTSFIPPMPVAADVSWDADSIDAADGTAVPEWISEDGFCSASTEVSGKTAPVLVKNAINGHSVLRFDSTKKTGLGLSSAESPVSGASDFTVAVVWRSDSDGKSYNSSLGHAYSAAGLVSTKQSASKSADFSLSYRPGSAVMAGYGHSSADQDITTRKPYRLNDGEVHITVFSCDGTAGSFNLMTDGMFHSGTLANVSARGTFDVMFGVYASHITTEGGFFDGDIAAIKLYGSALTKAQMRELGEYWAKKYATHLLAGHRFSVDRLKESGLSATNVMVASGARLSLPLTDETPFVLGTGARLSGEGGFVGSYRFAAGSVLDVSAAIPSMFDDLQMAGGTIRTDRSLLANGDALHVRRVKVSGENGVLVDGTGDLPRKIVLFTFDEAEVSEDAAWTVVGSKTALTSLVVDPVAKCATLVTRRGFTLNIR